LQFADDTLIFCEPEIEGLKNIKGVLELFREFSGLAVNFAKSGLIVFGKEEQWAQNAAETLQCNLVELPITYLGIPLGANMRRLSSWQAVLDKIRSKLSLWKANCLSRAGRLVLVKAVLNSLPLYYLSIFRLPKKVGHEINTIQRQFLWTGQNAGRFNALVKWKIVQQPKVKGGLGVDDLILKNAALLFKWWWRYTCEEGALWKRVVHSLHKEDHVFVPSQAIDMMPGPWRDLKKLAAEKGPIARAFFSNMKWQIGEVSSVKFWKDPWVLSEPLKVTFGSLFGVSTQKNEIIANMGWFEGNIWRWTLAWQRELLSEEVTQLQSLHDLLQQHHPVRDERDGVHWSSNRGFSVKNLMNEAEKINNGAAVCDSIVGTVWKKIAPPKVEFMLWLTLLGRLNTRDMLVKKGMLPQQDNWCGFCAEQPETIDHLLFQCQISWQVWRNIAEALRVQIDREMNFRQLYEKWMSKRYSNPLRRKLHIAAFFAIAWSLWTGRNKKVFEKQEIRLDMLCNLIRWRIVWWSKAWKEHHPYSVEELARNFDSIPVLFY